MSFKTREGQCISTDNISSITKIEPSDFNIFAFFHKIIIKYKDGSAVVLKVRPTNAWWTMRELQNFIK